jgi:hypothetical protein
MARIPEEELERVKREASVQQLAEAMEGDALRARKQPPRPLPLPTG